jgi:hypothetical protein
MKFPIVIVPKEISDYYKAGLEDDWIGLAFWSDVGTWYLYAGREESARADEGSDFWKKVLKCYRDNGYTEGEKEIWAHMLGKNG